MVGWRFPQTPRTKEHLPVFSEDFCVFIEPCLQHSARRFAMLSPFVAIHWFPKASHPSLSSQGIWFKYLGFLNCHPLSQRLQQFVCLKKWPWVVVSGVGKSQQEKPCPLSCSFRELPELPAWSAEDKQWHPLFSLWHLILKWLFSRPPLAWQTENGTKAS